MLQRTIAILAVLGGISACGRSAPHVVPRGAVTEHATIPSDTRVPMPQLTMRDGPNVWAHEWDDRAVIINDTTVLCPKRKSPGDSSRVDLVRLERFSRVAPESVQSIEKRSVVSDEVRKKCPTARKELRMTFRGRLPQ